MSLRRSIFLTQKRTKEDCFCFDRWRALFRNTSSILVQKCPQPLVRVHVMYEFESCTVSASMWVAEKGNAWVLSQLHQGSDQAERECVREREREENYMMFETYGRAIVCGISAGRLENREPCCLYFLCMYLAAIRRTYDVRVCTLSSIYIHIHHCLCFCCFVPNRFFLDNWSGRFFSFEIFT